MFLGGTATHTANPNIKAPDLAMSKPDESERSVWKRIGIYVYATSITNCVITEY